MNCPDLFFPSIHFYTITKSTFFKKNCFDVMMVWWVKCDYVYANKFSFFIWIVQIGGWCHCIDTINVLNQCMSAIPSGGYLMFGVEAVLSSHFIFPRFSRLLGCYYWIRLFQWMFNVPMGHVIVHVHNTVLYTLHYILYIYELFYAACKIWIFNFLNCIHESVSKMSFSWENFKYFHIIYVQCSLEF